MGSSRSIVFPGSRVVWPTISSKCYYHYNSCTVLLDKEPFSIQDNTGRGPMVVGQVPMLELFTVDFFILRSRFCAPQIPRTASLPNILRQVQGENSSIIKGQFLV